MPYNPEINEAMERSARGAFSQLQKELNAMTPKQLEGAEIVIHYFKANYMDAGYKKLARKLIKNDIEA